MFILSLTRLWREYDFANTILSTEQAQAAVRASKYPPVGKRSITGMLPHVGFSSISIAEASDLGNAQLSTVAVMVESPESVANIDAIAATEGVDVIFVGTNDLTIELGVPGDFDHPKFIEAIEAAAAAAKKYGKIFGLAGIYNRPDILHRFIHHYDARLIVGHVDLPLVAKATLATAAELTALESSSTYNS